MGRDRVSALLMQMGWWVWAEKTIRVVGISGRRGELCAQFFGRVRKIHMNWHVVWIEYLIEYWRRYHHQSHPSVLNRIPQCQMHLLNPLSRFQLKPLPEAFPKSVSAFSHILGNFSRSN
ncbi:hypothetical protein COP2_028325 [Malus domestica]